MVKNVHELHVVRKLGNNHIDRVLNQRDIPYPMSKKSIFFLHKINKIRVFTTGHFETSHGSHGLICCA